MDSKVLREITPLNENDFMYVADRHKKEFDYPIHIHDVLELNFVANAAGARRVVGDSSEVIDNLDLVLITSPDLEHVWEQYECKSEDIHEVTVQFRLNFDLDTSSFRFSSYKSIYDMLIRAQRGLAFPPEAIMLVYHRLARLSSIEEGFIAVQEFFSILYELSKFNDARELASSSFAKVEVVSESKRILKVKNYIDEHYKDDLSLEQLADLVGMTSTASSSVRQRISRSILLTFVWAMPLACWWTPATASAKFAGQLASTPSVTSTVCSASAKDAVPRNSVRNIRRQR